MEPGRSLDINIRLWFNVAIILCIGIFVYLIIFPKQMKCGLFLAVLGVIVTHFLYRGCIRYKTEGFTYDRELYKRNLQNLKNDNRIKDLRNNHIKRNQFFDRIFNGIVNILYQTDAVNRINVTQNNWQKKLTWDSSIANMKGIIYDVRNRKDVRSDRGNHKRRDSYKFLVNAGAQDRDVKNFRNDVYDLLQSHSDRNRITDRMIYVIEYMAERAFTLVRFSQNNTNKMQDLGKSCDGIDKPKSCPLCNEKPFCTSTGWACPSMWTRELPLPSVNDRCLGV